MSNPFQLSQQVDRRKKLAVVAGGALLGAGLSAVVGALLPAIGSPALAIGGVLAGALAGAAFGRTIARLVDTGPWEPMSTGRSYVGTHVPDEADSVEGSRTAARSIESSRAAYGQHARIQR
jgi:hypothetical protein